MIYILEQKLISIGNDFSVYDEVGNLVYYFDGRLLSFPPKTVIQSATGHVEGVLRRKIFALRPSYTLRLGHRTAAVIYRPFFALRRGVRVTTPSGRQIRATGAILEHDYTFMETGQTVATVRKKWFQGRDTYAVDVTNSSDDLIILSAAVVIDLMFHPKRDSTFGS